MRPRFARTVAAACAGGIAVALAGCEPREPSRPPVVMDQDLPRGGPQVPATGSSPVAAPTASVVASASPVIVDTSGPSGDAKALELSFHGPGALTLKNTTTLAMRVQTRARIERLDGGKWTATGINMLLQESCATGGAPIPACVALPPKASLRPVAWTGFMGCTQCKECDKNYPAFPGRYRFVVTSCDGASEKPSTEVEVKPAGNITGPPWAD